MVIQNNVPAPGAREGFQLNSTGFEKPVAKPSSFIKLFEDANEAARIALSEKTRAQSRSIFASKNTFSTNPVINMAAGASREIQTILHRMNTLAKQSASNKHDPTIDRAALDSEFQSLKEEIDRVAEAANAVLVDKNGVPTYRTQVLGVKFDANKDIEYTVNGESYMAKTDEHGNLYIYLPKSYDGATIELTIDGKVYQGILTVTENDANIVMLMEVLPPPTDIEIPDEDLIMDWLTPDGRMFSEADIGIFAIFGDHTEVEARAKTQRDNDTYTAQKHGNKTTVDDAATDIKAFAENPSPTAKRVTVNAADEPTGAADASATARVGADAYATAHINEPNSPDGYINSNIVNNAVVYYDPATEEAYTAADSHAVNVTSSGLIDSDIAQNDIYRAAAATTDTVVNGEEAENAFNAYDSPHDDKKDALAFLTKFIENRLTDKINNPVPVTEYSAVPVPEIVNANTAAANSADGKTYSSRAAAGIVAPLPVQQNNESTLLKLAIGSAGYQGPLIETDKSNTDAPFEKTSEHAPVISSGFTYRTADEAATVEFNCDQVGKSYYMVISRSGFQPGPGNAEILRNSPQSEQGSVVPGLNSIKLDSLTPGEFRIFVAIENLSGLSNMLPIDIPAYSPWEHVDISTKNGANAAIAAIEQKRDTFESMWKMIS